MPSTGVAHPDMKFIEFYIAVRFTLGFDQTAKQVDLLGWVDDLSRIKIEPHPLNANDPRSRQLSGKGD